MSMTMNAPPPVGPRGVALRCAIQGEAAWASGAPVLACPYGPARPFSRRAWVRGYVLAAIAAGATLPGDPELEDALDYDAPWPGDEVVGTA